MRIFLDTVIRRLLAATQVLAILTVGPCAAQQGDPQPQRLDPTALDNVVARVALYPDPLLAQVMAAASFVEQIPAAAQWADQHKSLKGDALAQAMGGAQLGFDPSVQALLAFPSVLDQMNQDLAWTQALGDATLVQRGDVMDAVQRMRRRAYDTGNLKSTSQITVVQSSPQVIVIQPPSPSVIYVPVYNPQVVYSPPAPGAVIAGAAIGFALAVALSPSYCNSYWGYHSGFGWSSRTIVVYNSAWGRTWVNHSSYRHTWGGSNVGFYARPYAYTNTNVYVRNNNVNVNRNVATPYGNANVNRNVNVNQRTGNVNVNQNARVNTPYGTANVNKNVNVNPNTGNVNRNLNVDKTYGNVNVNKNLNVNNNNGQVNVNKNTNVSGPNGSANVNKNANGNVYNAGSANRSTTTNVNPKAGSYPTNAGSVNRSAYPSNANSTNARGYAPPSSAPSGTFSGMQNGRSEQNAAARGKASRR